MSKRLTVNVTSEIGKLKGVILHAPGQEIENMTPENAQRALYSDILNLKIASSEYKQFEDVLKKVTSVYYVNDFLKGLVSEELIKQDLLSDILRNEPSLYLRDELLSFDAQTLATILIEGLPLKNDSLTNFLSKDRFSLQPLHNFFFMRDASISVWSNVLISRMANKVRERETGIMNSIFTHAFSTKVINPSKSITADPCITIEGGDVLVASENVLLIGVGKRTSSNGVDFIINQLAPLKNSTWHVIIQELPESPESFIHLDMVFTFLDRDKCMVYEPLILKRNKYQTILITVEPNGKKRFAYEENLLSALSKTGINPQPLFCGGRDNGWEQEREQWHSGANFFAVAPGKVIGYERNTHTVEELNNNGFEILKATEVIAGIKNPDDYARCMIALEGSELARGGGGARCMSMPFLREPL
jgi:arginine deiminase